MTAMPGYVWALVLLGLIGSTATVFVMLWRGALATGASRRHAGTVLASAGSAWAAWVLTNAALADAGAYRFTATNPQPWIPLALTVTLTAALLFARIPLVSRIIGQHDALWRMTVIQLFRPVGAVFLIAIAMALGELPAVFAVPAGLGDIAVGVWAAFVARNLRHGTAGGRTGRQAFWFNIFGIVDLVVAVTVGTVSAPGPAQLLFVSPSAEPISLLPLVLIPTTMVPLALALHVLSLRKLRSVSPTSSVPATVLIGSTR